MATRTHTESAVACDMGGARRGAGLAAALMVATACTSGTLVSSAPDPADVEVFMASGATRSQTAAARDALRRSKDVLRLDFIKREEAYRRFRRMFRDQPDLVGTTSAAGLPRSFLVELRDGADRRRFLRAVQRIPGVAFGVPIRTCAEVREELRERRSRSDVEVFLDVRASPDQARAVREEIRRSGLARRVTFVSKQDAYREFRRLFSDQPDLVATTSPEALPESFRIDVDRRRDGTRLARRVEALPGVDEIAIATDLSDFFPFGACAR